MENPFNIGGVCGILSFLSSAQSFNAPVSQKLKLPSELRNSRRGERGEEVELETWLSK